MKNEIQDLGEYEVTAWLRETGWPTQDFDQIEMLRIYSEWKILSPIGRFNRCLNEDLLINMITARMKELHPESKRNALIIATLLIIKAANLAEEEGLWAIA